MPDICPNSPPLHQDPFLNDSHCLIKLYSHKSINSLYPSPSLPSSSSSLCLFNYMLNISSLLTYCHLPSVCLDDSDNLPDSTFAPYMYSILLSLWQWCFQNTNLMVSPFCFNPIALRVTTIIFDTFYVLHNLSFTYYSNLISYLPCLHFILCPSSS